jgi:hypothetical protein
MADESKKDFWDKLSALTPLILGLAVTGVGGIFTQRFNEHQLQLSKIEALDKLRPLLSSSKPEERAFGYTAFSSLGYEKVAIQMIALNKDESGRPLLLEAQKSGSPEVKAQATSALDSLNKARMLVNINEFGTDNPQEALQKAEAAGNPEELKFARAVLNGYGPYEQWAQSEQKSLGSSSPLVLAILLDAAVQGGTSGAGKMRAEASQSVASPLDTTDKERQWSERFLDVRSQFLDAFVARDPAAAKFLPAWKKRIDRLREHVRAGDWDLTPQAFASAGNTTTATGTGK